MECERRNSTMRKKGYFFTMDALLALLLFTTIILLVHLFYINAPPLSQLHYLSRDTLDVLSTTKIKDLDLSYSLKDDYPEINEELTIVEQLKIYNDAGVTTTKEDIEDRLLKHLYPPQYQYSISFGDPTVESTSKIVVVSRKLVGSVEIE